MKRSVLIGGGAATIAAATAAFTGFSHYPGAYANAPAGIASSDEKSAPAITPAMRTAASMQTAFNEVAQAAGPAVVTITTLEHVPAPRANGGMGFPGFSFPGMRNRGGQGGADPFGGLLGPDGGGGNSPDAGTPPSGSGALRRAGLGSGFIIRGDGLILTNAHVVRGADSVTVKLSDGREFKNAKVLGQDTRTDVAVVKVPASGLPTVALADSDGVNVGDWAVAVGNPYGLDHTVTVGVISAKGREVPSETGSGQFLQTDASINPGNSGGPLLDIYGRVIGINNSIFSESGGNVGIGFAVPIDTAKRIADVLIRDGRVRRARLGVAIGDVSGQAAAFGLDATVKGALVDSVEPNSPAAHAGIEPGDVITSLNGKAVTKSSELQELVSNSTIGSTVSIDVLRGGQHKMVTARVEELKDGSVAKTASDDAANSQASGALGIRLAPLTADLAGQLGVDTSTRGVVVAGVVAGSPAQQAGIQTGDIVERVGQTPVATPEALKSAVSGILGREAAGDKTVALFINRRGERKYIIVSPQ
jgi:serine protease Do